MFDTDSKLHPGKRSIPTCSGQSLRNFGQIKYNVSATKPNGTLARARGTAFNARMYEIVYFHSGKHSPTANVPQEEYFCRRRLSPIAVPCWSYALSRRACDCFRAATDELYLTC